MNPVYILEEKHFIIDPDVYDLTLEFLNKLEKTSVMFPKLLLHKDCVSFEWLTCELHVYKDNTILITDHKKFYYDLPEEIINLLEILEATVPFKRSKPIHIPVRKRPSKKIQ